MKCPVCRHDKITFLGLWYEDYEDFYVLKNHYGCESCRVMITTIVSDDSFHYIKEDGSIIVRPPHVVIKHERRLHAVEVDPGFVVRKDNG